MEVTLTRFTNARRGRDATEIISIALRQPVARLRCPPRIGGVEANDNARAQALIAFYGTGLVRYGGTRKGVDGLDLASCQLAH